MIMILVVIIVLIALGTTTYASSLTVAATTIRITSHMAYCFISNSINT